MKTFDSIEISSLPIKDVWCDQAMTGAPSPDARRVWGIRDGKCKPLGWLMPQVNDFVRQQPRSLAEKLLVARRK